jgi:hypothetical protein
VYASRVYLKRKKNEFKRCERPLQKDTTAAVASTRIHTTHTQNRIWTFDIAVCLIMLHAGLACRIVYLCARRGKNRFSQ